MENRGKVNTALSYKVSKHQDLLDVKSSNMLSCYKNEQGITFEHPSTFFF